MEHFADDFVHIAMYIHDDKRFRTNGLSGFGKSEDGGISASVCVIVTFGHSTKCRINRACRQNCVIPYIQVLITKRTGGWFPSGNPTVLLAHYTSRNSPEDRNCAKTLRSMTEIMTETLTEITIA